MGAQNLSKQFSRVVQPVKGWAIASASLAFAAIAVTTSPTLSAARASKNFLWKVESETNTVYLLGSVHVLSEDNYPLPNAYEAAFDDAERIVFEIDLSEAESPASQQILLEKAAPDAEGEALFDSLSPDLYSAAKQEADTMGMSIEWFHNVEPWFFSISLSAFKLQQLGFVSEFGIDRHFFVRAEAAGKPVYALETFEEQLGFFDNLSIETQEELVRQALSEAETFEGDFDAIVSAWASGNVEQLGSFLLESFDQSPELYDVLIRQRNQTWMGPVESYLGQADDYLVVVGAGHLVGDDSLIQLLTDKGYSVEQL